MKASIKFREDQKPLLRAKVPISILGFPFQSGVAAGDSKELTLNLGTFFDSGPSLKFAYRPNDPLNPFSLVFKTGIGNFGSPISSPMTMSAEFNLIGNQNPSFFVHFKPRFGDFRIKKSQSSDLVKSIKSKPNGALSDEDGSIEVVETPVVLKSGYSTENDLFSGKRMAILPPESPRASLIGGLLSGAEASARTSMPVLNCAVVNFRWMLKFPAAEEAAAAALVKRNPTGGISFQKFPLLVMNKIQIQHVVHDDSKDSKKVDPVRDDVTETCLAVKRQLELINTENGMLRKAIDDLKSEFAAAKLGGVDRRNNGDKKSSQFNNFGGKATEGDVHDELKKALKGGAGA